MCKPPCTSSPRSLNIRVYTAQPRTRRPALCTTTTSGRIPRLATAYGRVVVSMPGPSYQTMEATNISRAHFIQPPKAEHMSIASPHHQP